MRYMSAEEKSSCINPIISLEIPKNEISSLNNHCKLLKTKKTTREA